MIIFLLHGNSLTGTIPDRFTNWTQLSLLSISHNRFTGTIPNSVWIQKRATRNGLNFFSFKDNLLKGTVPNDSCENMVINILGSPVTSLMVDDSIWFVDEPKITCECCGTANCHVWPEIKVNFTEVRRPPCPVNNLHSIDFEYFYGAIDLVVDSNYFSVPDVNDMTSVNGFSTDLCLSPTGCYSIFKDRKQLSSNFLSYSLGYLASSKALVEDEVCDPVEICGYFFDFNHPKRSGLNHLTQLAVHDLSILEDPSSPHYEALCWIMTKDVLFYEYEVCDGSLLQRYVLFYFYISEGKVNKNIIDSLTTKPTCEWQGVICDAKEKFVVHLNLTSRELLGTFPSELGLLTRLQSLDLSENELFGTIDSSIFNRLPFLEVFHIGGNNFGGEIPKNLFMLPKIKKLNISNNVFVGNLPDDIVYSETLGELFTTYLPVQNIFVFLLSHQIYIIISHLK